MKTLRHLELNPTFEKLIATGETWDFPADLEVYGRAAINFRNSWYGSQLDPVGSVVDEGHDEKVEKVLAVMKQFAEQQERRKEEKREENRSMFAENLPRANTTAEHAYPEVGTQTSVPTASSSTQAGATTASSSTQAGATTVSSGTEASVPAQATNFGPLGQRGSAPSFLERMARRQQKGPHPEEANNFTYRKDLTLARTEARLKVERNKALNRKRAQQFDISTPPAPPPKPRNPRFRQLKDKYDQRLMRANATRNRLVLPKAGKMHRAPRRETTDILNEKRNLDI